jgi:GNAT superfamily N-acetyltransferase
MDGRIERKMSDQLLKYRFKDSDLNLPEVQSFFCGPERWAVEVAEWIKSPAGVLDDIRNYPTTEVWLFRTGGGELVGFSSLGEQMVSLPMPKGPKRLVSCIPFMGVAKSFQRKPEGARREDRFASRILEDLIECAAEKTAKRPDLTAAMILSVDDGNKSAIGFYEKRGFADQKCPHKNKETGIVYRRMILNIGALVDRLRS